MEGWLRHRLPFTRASAASKIVVPPEIGVPEAKIYGKPTVKLTDGKIHLG